jgi:alpha-L-rhamnosidase
MLRTLFVLGCCLLIFPLFSQELNLSQAKFIPKKWNAYWLTHPKISGGEHAVVLFRNSFDLGVKPDSFLVNITADNHYSLFVNGQLVCKGPQLSDIRNWRYETLNLAPYLKVGKNTVAVEVLNFGYYRFFGMQSVHTGLLVNGLGEREKAINTEPRTGTWKTYWNKAIHEREVKWRAWPPDIIGGFYACNPTDSVHCESYPWAWEQPDFDDTQWEKARYLENAAAFGGSFGWMLEPRNVPIQKSTVERISKVTKVSGVAPPSDFLQGKSPWTIPANSKVTVLLDQTYLTMGYPEIRFSGGKNARIRLGYAENLFNPDKSKSNRNEIEGKNFVGYKDVLVADGKAHHYRPTWLRTFRFVQIEIFTAEEALTIEDYFNHYTVTPIPVAAQFRCDQPMYERIFDICQRTAHLCTQDYFLSDAYYETMQYLGDSKVHALVWQALTGNDLHTRNALQQFNDSRLPDGNLTSCYPLKSTFVHPTYSVIWVDMLWDYLRYSGDKAYVKQLLPGIRHTLEGFDQLIQANGLAGPTQWDYFVDWYVEAASGGVSPGNKGVNSAVVTLHYVYALQNAANIYTALGMPADAQRCLSRATAIRQKVYTQCYDAKRGIFAERPDKSFYDMHSNIMAILTGAVPKEQFRPILQKILTEKGISPATYYYRFYLFEALKVANAGDLYDLAQKPWESLVNDGMTTTLERFEDGKKPTRSEAHPWSTAPAYACFSLIAGINPSGLGFQKIVVKPSLGILQKVEGLYPTPLGNVAFDLSKKGSQGLSAKLNLPAGMSGILEWNGKKLPLKAGENNLEL